MHLHNRFCALLFQSLLLWHPHPTAERQMSEGHRGFHRTPASQQGLAEGPTWVSIASQNCLIACLWLCTCMWEAETWRVTPNAYLLLTSIARTCTSSLTGEAVGCTPTMSSFFNCQIFLC